MKVYLDTSVVSALFDEKNPERMALTEEFFEAIENYQVFISEITISEINKTPDSVLRDKMRDVIVNFNILQLSQEIDDLAKEYITHDAIPNKYKEDAYHIAVAVFSEMDYLLSWNFRHIVEAVGKPLVWNLARYRIACTNEKPPFSSVQAILG